MGDIGYYDQEGKLNIVNYTADPYKVVMSELLVSGPVIGQFSSILIFTEWISQLINNF